MARLLSVPNGLGIVSMEPLSGPRAVGAGGSQSVSGFVQTSAAAFGLWRWQFSFHAMRESEFRRYRGWVTALHGGANATRWDFFDPDQMRPAETGYDIPDFVRWDNIAGRDWSNGEPWANGEPWKATPPLVPVAAATGREGTVIRLGSQFWGRVLDIGDYIGFAPFHFGLYTITEVISPGEYRIWPPLRKSVTAGDFATLRPALAMRLESEDSASAGRGLVTADSVTVTLVECLDYDVREYWTD